MGNWQPCPSPAQLDGYTHIIIAFAVTYSWNCDGCQNTCDTECNVAVPPVCVGGGQATIDAWRAAGKKVIMSFGGAGMGGSWSGDNNNCWDYCFGKEEQLSTQLVDMVSAMNLDGIDIDYEYCYDVEGTQAGRCNQRTCKYSDEAAQYFLAEMNIQLRTKLSALPNGDHQELTHAPMDSDLVPESQYYQILKSQNEYFDL